jgi:alanine racemase
MDMIVVALGDVSAGRGKYQTVRPGDVATIIGCDGRGAISAWEAAEKAGASHYEFVTRLNPLMERIVV